MRINTEYPADLSIRIITLLIILAKRSSIIALNEHPQHRNQDPYEILQIPREASFSTIRQAYLRLARIYHPDRGGDSATVISVHNAYVALTQANRIMPPLMLENRSASIVEMLYDAIRDLARVFQREILSHSLSNLALQLMSTSHASVVRSSLFSLQQANQPLFQMPANRSPYYAYIPNEVLQQLDQPRSRLAERFNQPLLRAPVNRSYRNQTTFLYDENILDVSQENFLALDGFGFAVDELRDYVEHDLSKLYTNPHIKTGDREFSETAKQILRNHQLLGPYARRLDSLLIEQKFGIKEATIDAVVKMLLNFAKYDVEGSGHARAEFCIYYQEELNAIEQSKLFNYLIKVTSLYGGTQNFTFAAAFNADCIKIAQTFLWQFVIDIKPELYQKIPAAVLQMARESQNLVITLQENRSRVSQSQFFRRQPLHFNENNQPINHREPLLGFMNRSNHWELLLGVINRLNHREALMRFIDRAVAMELMREALHRLFPRDPDAAIPNPVINVEIEALDEVDMEEDGVWLFRP